MPFLNRYEDGWGAEVLIRRMISYRHSYFINGLVNRYNYLFPRDLKLTFGCAAGEFTM